MVNLLVIDNYDSFVYTIVDYLAQLGATPTVKRNDAVSVDAAGNYDAVVISPGPGTPDEAGVSKDMIRYCADHDIPLLGVCLGHQALAEVYGATVSHAPELLHGKTSQIEHGDSVVFEGLPSPLQVTRYHSLAVDPQSVPDDLEVTAMTTSGVIMGLQHKTKPLTGVQFHPESILTIGGHRMFANWLASVGQEDALERAEGKAPLVIE